jgi:hypothetical protein
MYEGRISSFALSEDTTCPARLRKRDRPRFARFAAENKSLARNNKSPDASNATNERPWRKELRR